MEQIERPYPRKPLFQNLDRWFQVLRNYRTSQLLQRVKSLLRRKLLQLRRGGRFARLHVTLPFRDNPGFSRILSRKFLLLSNNSEIEKAHHLLEGTFAFLHETRNLPDPIPWHVPDAPHLWRFHLHYQDYLLPLAHAERKQGDSKYLGRAWDLVRQWIDGNKLDDPRVYMEGWHPYCISRRLPNWMMLWTASPPPNSIIESVLQSMHAQAHFLAENLEYDVRGNHLLENGRALILAGCFFTGAEADHWLKQGSAIFRQELPTQILPHGEHFERSPMYHCQMLDVILDLADALEHVQPETAKPYRDLAQKMGQFLRAIVHPDGQIPLLSDSAQEEAPSPQVLLDAVCPGAEQLQGGHAQGGYWTFRDEDHFILFDAAPLGPDELPAHAHADLLTLEATVSGKRLFVDSGVFNYQSDAMRYYCRSTRAHNVLEVDGQDQCDIWSRFRMGRRGHPHSFESGFYDGFHWVRAFHDAYRHLGVPRVGRWLACRSGGPWICLDLAEGKGTHHLINRLHFHPEIRIRQIQPDTFEMQMDETTLFLHLLTPGNAHLTKGWYCPEFGVRREKMVMEWHGQGRLPAASGWVLSWDEKIPGIRLDRENDAWQIQLPHRDKPIVFRPFHDFPETSS